MRLSSVLFSCLSLSSLALASMGCHREDQRPTQAMDNPPRDDRRAQVQTPPPPISPDADKTCPGGSDALCGDKQLCVRDRCVDITAGVAECSMSRLHFDTDSADIRGEDRQTLERMARCLKADQTMAVVIEGNTDNRGTADYNLALGDRRATAVARYLQNLGVTSEQMRVISFGATNPLCVDNDESCFSKNRRAAIKPQPNSRRR